MHSNAVCTEFVPRVFVLHFMPQDLHFACVHTLHTVRQRILTAYHYRTLSFFLAPARLSTVVTMSSREPKRCIFVAYLANRTP